LSTLGGSFPALPPALLDPFGSFAKVLPVAKPRAPIWLKTSSSKRGGRDSNAFAENATEPENSAASSSGARLDKTPIDTGSRPFASGSPPFVTGVSKITDAELVDAAARAMLEGRGELAEFLIREVRQRRERATGNVVPIQSKRPG
jgi:hypothetical protein